MGTGTVAGRVYVMGDEVPQLFAINEVYDPQSNTWTTAAPLPVPRHGMPAVRLAGGLILPGGGTVQGLQPTTHVDAYEPFARGDLNCDAVIDFFDIDPFLACLFGGACP